MVNLSPLYVRLHRYWGLAVACALLAMLSSCGMMESDTGNDCTTHRRVRFVFDMNMLFSDAFAHEVDSVTLYAYDTNGRLALTKREAVAAIADRGYMDVDELNPGVYTFRVWATGQTRYADSYTFGQAEVGSNDSTRLSVRVNRDGRSVDHDITSLFFGVTRQVDMTDIPLGGIRTATVYLMKDTNNFRVVLQNLSGENLSASDFHFEITDDNGYLDYNNNLLPDDTLSYHAWAQQSGQAGIGQDSTSTITGVSAVVAELTTNRLIKGHDMRLHITDNKGKMIVNIPLIDYCLLVKGNYNRAMSDQEYLDRQDTYSLVFFIDNQRNWLSASIYINSWRVVLQSADL